MASITFIYRIHNQSKAFYGKLVKPTLSDDHEGIDREVRNYVLSGLNAYRKQKNMAPFADGSKLQIGILGMMNGNIYFCTHDERTCFDFYAREQEQGRVHYYINGREISVDNGGQVSQATA